MYKLDITYLDALSRAEKLMYRNKGCCVVSCKTDANDYELYFLIPAETEKSEFDRLEKRSSYCFTGLMIWLLREP